MSDRFPPHCYYCDANYFHNADEYERHIVTRHALQPGYPNAGDMISLKLKSQNMSWEKPLPEYKVHEFIQNYMPKDRKKKSQSKPLA